MSTPFEFEDKSDWTGCAMLEVFCDRTTGVRHLALRHKDKTLCSGVKQLDSKCRYQEDDDDYPLRSYATNREAFEDATCESCRQHAQSYRDDLTWPVEREQKEPFFDEELRTLSVEEYRALRRGHRALRIEVERLRQFCSELEAEGNGAAEELDETLVGRAALIESLRVVIRRHPELREEILSTITNVWLRKEIADGSPPANIG